MPILDRERLTNYPRIFLALYVSIGGWWVLSGPGLLDRSGKPVGVDFVTFYAVSRLALEGRAASVWGIEPITAVERAVIGSDIPSYVFHYPPTFVLALTPLALLPYLPALALWWASSTAAFVWAVRRIAPFPVTTGLALSFPGFFQNIIQGQNGAFTAALLGGGLALLDTRPAAAGVLLGALSYKPHLAPLVGVALIAGRRWRAGVTALATALGMVVASISVFGVSPWQSFLENVPFAVRVLETEGVLPWFRMPTVQVAAMLAGVPVAGARAAQTISSLVAFGLVAWAWGRGASATTRAVVLACAAVLATPFGFDYDLAVLAVPIAVLAVRYGPPALARDAPPATGGGTPSPGSWAPPAYEIPVLTAAWAAPLWVPAVAQATDIGLAPALLVALIGVALARERAA